MTKDSKLLFARRPPPARPGLRARALRPALLPLPPARRAASLPVCESPRVSSNPSYAACDQRPLADLELTFLRSVLPASPGLNRKPRAPQLPGRGKISFVATQHAEEVRSEPEQSPAGSAGRILSSQVRPLCSVWVGARGPARRWEPAATRRAEGPVPMSPRQRP